MNKLIASSSNPEKLSMTIQGILMALVPITLAIFQIANIPASETDLVEIVQGITAAVSAVTMLYGMIRKFINNFVK